MSNVINFNPYTNISQAFMLVDKMRERGYELVLMYETAKNIWTAVIEHEIPDPLRVFEATADTPAQAICLACIKTLDQ